MIKFLFLAFLGIILSCGENGDGIDALLIKYKDDAPDSLRVEPQVVSNDTSETLVVGLAQDLGTETFKTHIGLTEDFQMVTDAFYVKPEGEFDPNGIAVFLDIKFALNSGQSAKANKVIFYHVQTSSSKSAVGFIHPETVKSNEIRFKTLGYGIYQVISLNNDVASIQKQSATFVFEQASNFEELVLGNWVDPAAGSPPQSAPSSISFVDEDPTANEIAGDLILYKAADESDIETYKVYWGDDNLDIVIPGPLTTLVKTGNDIQFEVPQGTVIPAGATKFLAF